MPEGCIIVLSTALFVVQNISRKRSLSSCALYWSSVRPRCVMILVSVFLWSGVRSARLTQINASKLSPKGNAILCCCRLFSLSCLNAIKACSSVHGTLTCGSCPGVAAAGPASSAWWSSCSCRRRATNRIASVLVVNKSGSRSIQDSISLFPVSWNLVIHFWRSMVPLLYFMSAWNGIRTRSGHSWHHR